MARDVPHGETLVRQLFSLVNDGDFERALELCHPEVEAVLKAPSGQVVRGLNEVASYFREVAECPMYEVSVAKIRSLDQRRVVVEGRMRWMGDDHVLRDDPVVWALELEDGLLRRSTPVRTVTEAEALLSAAPRDAE